MGQILKFNPLDNLINNTETIHFKVNRPVQIINDADVKDIKFICKLIRLSDFDFPLVDYNFTTSTWIVAPGSFGQDKTNNPFCIWLNCNHTVVTCIRLFRQFGWELTFPHWYRA